MIGPVSDSSNDVVDGDDVGVGQRRDRSGLAQGARSDLLRIGRPHVAGDVDLLQRHPAAQQLICRRPDGAGRPVTDHRIQPVPAVDHSRRCPAARSVGVGWDWSGSPAAPAGRSWGGGAVGVTPQLCHHQPRVDLHHAGLPCACQRHSAAYAGPLTVTCRRQVPGLKRCNCIVTLLGMNAANAIADPVRREILEFLLAGPAPAGIIAAHFAISRPAVSRHLRVLRESGLVIDHMDGPAADVQPGPDAAPRDHRVDQQIRYIGRLGAAPGRAGNRGRPHQAAAACATTPEQSNRETA